MLDRKLKKLPFLQAVIEVEDIKKTIDKIVEKIILLIIPTKLETK